MSRTDRLLVVPTGVSDWKFFLGGQRGFIKLAKIIYVNPISKWNGILIPCDIVKYGTDLPQEFLQSNLWVLNESKYRVSNVNSCGGSIFKKSVAHHAVTFRFRSTDNSDISVMVGGKNY